MKRLLRQSDLDRIFELDQEALKSNWSRKDYDLEVKSPASICLALELDGAIQGYVIVRTSFFEAELLQIVIAPLYQNKCHGQKLLKAVMDELVLMGIKSLFLEVAKTNRSALEVYKKLGFTLIRKRDHYYGENKHGLVMRKELLA